MPPEWLASVPPWLLAGLALGLGASVAVAGLFVLGDRLFPEGPTSSDRTARTDGTERRRTEIREYLRTIGEPYVEDHAVDGRRIDFYLPDREVAITFDAQAYFRLESAGVRTVLCEHEMPGWQLGRRLPFETPDLGESMASAPDPVTTAFAELGLSPDADLEEVRAAYRERVKDVHPDQGGDPERFQRVREAYATARNHAD